MFLLALLVFFTSGFAALVYQVVWQRLLTIFSGVDVHSATLVVAAFMTGLGCGSLAGGQAADRLSRVNSLRLFMAAELAIAAFGFVSTTFFYDVLYHRLGPVGLGLAPTSAILFASLLWPTFFMGASLPLLARALTRDIARAASTVGWLYAFNTLGAAAGALCGTWWLLPRWGLDGSARVAATLNLACAGAAFALVAAARPVSARQPSGGSTQGATLSTTVAPPAAGASGPPLSVTATVFALSGFVALSLEIVWFRLLGVMLKSTTFTFGTLLAIYLVGLGGGAAIGSVIANRSRRPAVGFLFLQAAAGVYAAMSLSVLVTQLDDWPSLQWFASYSRGYDGVDIAAAADQLRALVAGWRGIGSAGTDWPSDFLRLYLLLPAVLVGPPTLMMGCSFPLLQKVAQTDLERLGRRVGILLGANIAGSTLGAFVTGWVLLGQLGTAGTLRLLVSVMSLFGILALWQLLGASRPRRRITICSAAALVAVGSAAAIPSARELWAALHGATPRQILTVEDGSGLAVLRTETRFNAEAGYFPRVVVFTNGVGQSWLPYGEIHTVLGALPAFLHPHPRHAAIIGLGSGDTLYAMAGRQELDHITSIEIVRPQLAALDQLAQLYRYPPVASIRGSGRIEHVFADGRLYIRRSGKNYDIIEADALRPRSAYSGNLYSDTYFELLRDHLNPGGLAVSWAPTERVATTFVRVFPYAWRAGQVIMGSNQPIDLDREAILQRLRDPPVESHYRSASVDVTKLLRPYISGPWQRYDPAHNRAALVDINTDLRPRDEFAMDR